MKMMMMKEKRRKKRKKREKKRKTHCLVRRRSYRAKLEQSHFRQMEKKKRKKDCEGRQANGQK